MKVKPTKRSAPVRGAEERRRNSRNAKRRPTDAQQRRKPAREQRPQRSAPATNPIPRPTEAPGRPKNASQAKARAKARKAKAPKVIRPPLRERIVVRLTSIDFNPRNLVARVPFVVLVIGSLGVGLGTTLWLSTDAAERSYQLGSARETNQALLQQKEALERDVLRAQAAPALAEAARNLGMIPSRDTAHLVQDPAGNWIVVGTPKPAEGVPPPPLNSPLPDEAPPAPPAAPAPRVVEPRELAVRLPDRTPAAQLPGTPPVPGAPLVPLAPGAPGAAAIPVAPAAPLAPAAPSAPVTPVAPLAAPGVEVPHAVTQPVAPGPVPAAPPAVVPDQPQVAPLDAGTPPVAPIPGAPA